MTPSWGPGRVWRARGRAAAARARQHVGARGEHAVGARLRAGAGRRPARDDREVAPRAAALCGVRGGGVCMRACARALAGAAHRARGRARGSWRWLRRVHPQRRRRRMRSAAAPTAGTLGPASACAHDALGHVVNNKRTLHVNGCAHCARLAPLSAVNGLELHVDRRLRARATASVLTNTNHPSVRAQHCARWR